MNKLDVSKYFEIPRGFRDRNYHIYDSLEEALTEQVLKPDYKKKIEQYYKLEGQINGLKKPVTLSPMEEEGDFMYSRHSRKKIPVTNNTERNFHQLTVEELMRILKLEELDSIESLFEPINRKELIEDYLQNFFTDKHEAISLVRARSFYASSPIIIDEEDVTQDIIDTFISLKKKKIDNKVKLQDIFKIDEVNEFIQTHLIHPQFIYSIDGKENVCEALTQLNPAYEYEYIICQASISHYYQNAFDFQNQLKELNDVYTIHLSGFSSVDIYQLKSFNLLDIHKKLFSREKQAFNFKMMEVNKELRGVNSIKSKFIRDVKQKVKLIESDWKSEFSKHKNKISEVNSWYNGEVAYLEFLDGSFMVWY